MGISIAHYSRICLYPRSSSENVEVRGQLLTLNLRGACHIILQASSMSPWSKTLPPNIVADLRLLRPVIQIYRGEQWYQLLEEALLLALDCARHLGDDESILRYSLELLSNGIFVPLVSPSLTSLEFSLKNNRDAFTVPSFISTSTTTQNTTKPEIKINATEFVSFGFYPRSPFFSYHLVNPSFTFQSKSAFAGSLVAFQLALRSQARKSVPAIVIRLVRISFNEQIPEILVTHSHSESHGVQKISPNARSAEADLSLHPGQNRVLEFSFTPIAPAQIEVSPLFLSF